MLETGPHVPCQLGALGLAPAMHSSVTSASTAPCQEGSGPAEAAECVGELLPTGSQHLHTGHTGTPSVRAFTCIWLRLLLKPVWSTRSLAPHSTI